MPVKRYGKDRKEYFLSNRDYRELYRKNNWQGGFIGAPELVYSGPARECSAIPGGIGSAIR